MEVLEGDGQHPERSFEVRGVICSAAPIQNHYTKSRFKGGNISPSPTGKANAAGSAWANPKCLPNAKGRQKK
jgi:hypothetical protein